MSTYDILVYLVPPVACALAKALIPRSDTPAELIETEQSLRAKKMVFIQDHYDTLKELDELYPAAKVLES